jgi:beta-galactosidase
VAVAGAAKPVNLALTSRVSVSSSRPGYPKEGAIDGKPETQWSTDVGQVTGQWLQLEWDQPQKIGGVLLRSTGPWTDAVDVQVERDGKRVSVGRAETPGKKLPNLIGIPFEAQTATALRLEFKGGAAFYDVEVYGDHTAVEDILAKMDVFVAGDARGQLIGVVAGAEGTGVADAPVEAVGTCPTGPWRRTVKAGPDGFWSLPLPLGTTGKIEVTARSGRHGQSVTVDRADLTQQVTPAPADVNSQVSLDGTWDFMVDPPVDFLSRLDAQKWAAIKVPAHWEMEGFVSESGLGLYRKQFEVPSGWAGKRVRLRAEAVYSSCEVWVNGRRAGSHDGGATPFEMDISDAVHPGGQNELVVLIHARSKAADIDAASVFAYYELAGIWQSVKVFCVEPEHVSRLAVSTEFDPDYRDAEVIVDAEVANEQARPAGELKLNCRLYNPAGKQVAVEGLTAKCSLAAWEAKKVRLKAKVTAPEQWNAERPRLYRLVAELKRPDGQIRVLEQQLGFRQIKVDGDQLLFNGKPLKIRGISRLEAHPLMGRALTREMCRRDVELMKVANFNACRATIFPPHSCMLDDCDELGIYVEDEGPACWFERKDDLSYGLLYVGIMSEQIERDRNHPCVFLWSLVNESEYGSVIQMTHHYAKASDLTRVCSMTFAPDNSDLDLAVYHHPVSLQRIHAASSVPKPAFFDECLTPFHGHDYLAYYLDQDPGMHDYWATGVADIVKAVIEGRNQVGTMQFSWTDDQALVPGKGTAYWRRYHPPIRYMDSVYKMPGRGIVGDTVWGTLDGWRRARPEYWLSKKLYSPIQIEEKPLAVPPAGSAIAVEVANINTFVDLSAYVCRWKLADESGETRVSVPPGGQGVLPITTKRRPGPNDVLTLEFYEAGETPTPQGRSALIDGYRLRFSPHEIPRLPNSGRPARIAEQTPYLDGARPIRLLGPDVELAYDQTAGNLYRALAQREVLMVAGPTLHVFRSDSPTRVYPEGWKFTGAKTRTEGSQAALEWNGTFGSEFTGGYQIKMDDAGDVEIGYRFTYQGEDMYAHEIGLAFALPLDFDRLSWDRRAEYSYYPDDHIGRPVGTAVAHPNVKQTVPPGDRPWALDDHAWGCNDFRGVKRNIYTASMTNAAGQGICVISDGKQSVRATMGVHEITLRVLDFYGGSGHPRDWSSQGFHYGAGKVVKKGEILQGTVRLQLLGTPAPVSELRTAARGGLEGDRVQR